MIILSLQPTPLLDETRKKLRNYRDECKNIVFTGQTPSTGKGNVFLFTGERVVEYERFPAIEF